MKKAGAGTLARIAGAGVTLTGLSLAAGACMGAVEDSDRADDEPIEKVDAAEEGLTQFLTGTAWACERSIALGNAWGDLQQQCLSSCNTYCAAGAGVQESCSYDNWESGRHFCPSTGVVWYCSVFTTCESPPSSSETGGGSGGPSDEAGGCSSDWDCPTSMECCSGSCIYLGCC